MKPAFRSAGTGRSSAAICAQAACQFLEPHTAQRSATEPKLPTMTSLLIGRFQPLHEGHAKLVETLLGEGKKVIIALRDGPRSSANPYSADERQQMFQKRFGEKVHVISLPEDGSLEVVRGRDVGWELRTLSLEPE